MKMQRYEKKWKGQSGEWSNQAKFVPVAEVFGNLILKNGHTRSNNTPSNLDNCTGV